MLISVLLTEYTYIEELCKRTFTKVVSFSYLDAIETKTPRFGYRLGHICYLDAVETKSPRFGYRLGHSCYLDAVETKTPRFGYRLGHTCYLDAVETKAPRFGYRLGHSFILSPSLFFCCGEVLIWLIWSPQYCVHLCTLEILRSYRLS